MCLEDPLRQRYRYDSFFQPSAPAEERTSEWAALLIDVDIDYWLDWLCGFRVFARTRMKLALRGSAAKPRTHLDAGWSEASV